MGRDGRGRPRVDDIRCANEGEARARLLLCRQAVQILQARGRSAVAHGFRSSFREWAAEETAHSREVIEAAFAHVVPSKVEAAYARANLFDRRRVLLDDWAAYLAGQPAPKGVRARS